MKIHIESLNEGRRIVASYSHADKMAYELSRTAALVDQARQLVGENVDHPLYSMVVHAHATLKSIVCETDPDNGKMFVESDNPHAPELPVYKHAASFCRLHPGVAYIQKTAVPFIVNMDGDETQLPQSYFMRCVHAFSELLLHQVQGYRRDKTTHHASTTLDYFRSLEDFFAGYKMIVLAPTAGLPIHTSKIDTTIRSAELAIWGDYRITQELAHADPKEIVRERFYALF